MEDLHKVGGTPAVMKRLLEAGLLHGDCMTVTGRTLAENLAELPGLAPGQQIVHALSDPIKETGPHPDPARQPRARGLLSRRSPGRRASPSAARRRCSTARRRCSLRWNAARSATGEVIVIRYEGPKGGPGMPEMLDAAPPRSWARGSATRSR